MILVASRWSCIIIGTRSGVSYSANLLLHLANLSLIHCLPFRCMHFPSTACLQRPVQCCRGRRQSILSAPYNYFDAARCTRMILLEFRLLRMQHGALNTFHVLYGCCANPRCALCMLCCCVPTVLSRACSHIVEFQHSPRIYKHNKTFKCEH